MNAWIIIWRYNNCSKYLLVPAAIPFPRDLPPSADWSRSDRVWRAWMVTAGLTRLPLPEFRGGTEMLTWGSARGYNWGGTKQEAIKQTPEKRSNRSPVSAREWGGYGEKGKEKPREETQKNQPWFWTVFFRPSPSTLWIVTYSVYI